MRFVHIGGTEEGRWKWFTLPGSDLQLELYCPTIDEYAAIAAQFRIGTRDADVLGYCREIAKRFFRAFRNGIDQLGQPIPNTPEMRAAILQAGDVYVYVTATLADASRWRTEGNGGSGTA